MPNNSSLPNHNLYQPRQKMQNGFEWLSDFVSKIVGSPVWFFLSLIIVLIWLPSRFLFKTDELWHLFINTFTTIFTFLMMSLLHSSQSKWEHRMESLEKQQERALKILEKETEEIITTIDSVETTKNPSKNTTGTQKPTNYVSSLL